MSSLPGPSLPVTSLYAGVLGIGFAAFSLNVGLTRVKKNQMYGSDNNEDLQHKSRAQGNFIEYTAYGTVLLALMEYNKSLSANKLWWWGFAFTALRYGHAFQLLAPKKIPLPVRAGSFLGTLALLTLASARLVQHALK